MVDRDGLENRCACKRTVGSNPTLSANSNWSNALIRREQFQRQLTAKNNPCDRHDGASPRSDGGRRLVARQRSEQYFTFPQSRSNFFRQTKGLPQTVQSLVGRSVLRRMRAM